MSRVISQLVWMFTADDEHFGRDLCERLRRVIHEFIVLSQYCLQGGTEAVERMIQTRLVSGGRMLLLVSCHLSIIVIFRFSSLKLLYPWK